VFWCGRGRVALMDCKNRGEANGGGFGRK